jgi:DNA-binding transcriptional MerR regulator
MAARLLGTTDVALRLGCSAERVRQLEAEGKLTAERTASGQRIFFADDVEQFAQERAAMKATSATGGQQ